MTAADFLTSPIWGAWEDIFLGGELKARPTPRVAAKAVEVAASKAVESAALKADLGQSLQVEGGQCEKGMGCSSSPSSQSSRSRLPIAAAEPRHHEEAQKLAAALVQDLLDLSGPDRDREILIRRSEVAEGIQQIQHVLQETERAIVNGQESILVHTTERECYASRLRWAADMTVGLQRGVKSLAKCDGAESAHREYTRLQDLLHKCEQEQARVAHALVTAASAGSRDARHDVEDQFPSVEQFGAALAAEVRDTLKETFTEVFDMFSPFLTPTDDYEENPR